MNLGSRHKVDPTFNMSSMTDMVFLLLIFFILTSSVVETGLPVSLPSSKNSQIVTQTINITITKDLKYQIGTDEKNVVSLDRLEKELKRALPEKDMTENVIVIRADKDIKYDDVMKVASIAAGMKAKVSLATGQE